MTIEASTSGYPQGKAAGLTAKPASSALGEVCTIHCRVPKMQPACNHHGIDTEANHLDIASFTGVALLTGRPGGMKAGLSCEYFRKRCPQNPLRILFQIHIGLRIVIFGALNRPQICRWFWNLKMIMEMGMIAM
jgi:hypothetical protein